MAINPGTRYTGKITAPSANYPLGSARDITTPGDGTGTPWEQNLINDVWGFLQKLLDGAGITASDVPDTVLASQYYQAVMALIGRASTLVFENTTTLAAGTTVLGETVVFVEKQILKVQAEGATVRFFVVTTDSSSPNISLGGGLYAEEVFVNSNPITGTFDAEIRTPFSDVLSVKTWGYIKIGSLVTLTVPTDHLVNSTANDYFEVSPPASPGTWPSDIVPAIKRHIPIVAHVEGAAATNRRVGVLEIENGSSTNFIGMVPDASAAILPTGWGFSASGSKGLPAQTLPAYSVI